MRFWNEQAPFLPPRSAVLGSCLALIACSGGGAPRFHGSGFSIPTTFGEGSPQEPVSAPSARANAPVAKEAPPPPPPKGSLPDPEPLRQAEQVEYELLWNRGTIEVLKSTPKTFAKPVVTARRMGRFAIELWIGPELVERVRFDFPLLAVEEPPQSDVGPEPPSLERGVYSRLRVLVPRAPRARRAVLVDRATSETIALPWPP